MQASCVGEVARGAATALCLLHLVGGSAKRTKVALDGGRGCLRLALVAGIALRSPGDISRPALLAALAQREALRVGVLTGLHSTHAFSPNEAWNVPTRQLLQTSAPVRLVKVPGVHS